MITKRCTLCGALKPLSEFHKHKNTPDGRYCRCKTCKNQQRKYERGYSNPVDPKGNVCDILKHHHEELKNDPEHLSCDFLKKIIGVDCK